MARRISILLGILLSVVFLVVVWAFFFGWSATNEAWRAEITGKPRSPAQMRGILQSMLSTRRTAAPPAFIPISMWDDDVCAAAVVNAVNFIAGDERLKVAPAWMFSRVNAGALTLAYSRAQDFAVQGKRVVEKHDRPIRLSDHLRMAGKKPQRTAGGLYIVGYLYRHTRSHELIVEAGADLNSHLMLILGRDDGRWWGYHLLHDPEHEERNPFRIDDLGEQMPADFDLIYIWEIKDTEMPTQGVPMLLASRAPRYEDALPWIGWGFNGRVEYVLDTAITALRFGGLEQFPRAITAKRTLVEVEPAWSTYGDHGEVLGAYKGIPVYRHRRDYGARTPFGQAYQCAEFVNRFYSERLGRRNMQRTGHADSYFYGAAAKGLQAFPNGSPEPPRIDDVLVFDPPGADDGHPGHVGIVYQVTASKVCVVQQNMVPWYGCLALTRRDGGYQVGAINQDLPCVGWARKR